MTTSILKMRLYFAKLLPTLPQILFLFDTVPLHVSTALQARETRNSRAICRTLLSQPTAVTSRPRSRKASSSLLVVNRRLLSV